MADRYAFSDDEEDSLRGRSVISGDSGSSERPVKRARTTTTTTTKPKKPRRAPVPSVASSEDDGSASSSSSSSEEEEDEDSAYTEGDDEEEEEEESESEFSDEEIFRSTALKSRVPSSKPARRRRERRPAKLKLLELDFVLKKAHELCCRSLDYGGAEQTSGAPYDATLSLALGAWLKSLDRRFAAFDRKANEFENLERKMIQLQRGHTAARDKLDALVVRERNLRRTILAREQARAERDKASDAIRAANQLVAFLA